MRAMLLIEIQSKEAGLRVTGGLQSWRATAVTLNTEDAHSMYTASDLCVQTCLFAEGWVVG